jgi:hypothetical protein
MRLQTESRRLSRGADMSVDLSRASSFSFGGSSSGKRMSFAPLTGSSVARMQNHRRISSVSDSEVDNGQPGSISPNSQMVTLPDASPNPCYLPAGPRRISGLFARATAPESEPVPGFNVVEREKLQREIQALNTALDEARHELMEANEAREASETCVKTLRDFIAENNVGVPSPCVDVSPTGAHGDDADKRAASGSGSGSSRWGFGGLFRVGEVNSPVIPSRGGAPASVSLSAAGEPLSRKLGGLFGGRGSFSSSTSAQPRGVPVVQEALYNGSDTASTVESAELASPRMDTSHVPTARVLSETSSTSCEVLGLQNISEETQISGKGQAEILMV